MLLRHGGKQLLLAGDNGYARKSWRDGILPGLMKDPENMDTEIISGIKAACGADFPVTCRFSIRNHMEDRPEGTAAKKYIVTGAAGHLGSTVIRELSASGCEICGLLQPGGTPKVTGPNISYREGDICDIESLRCLFGGAEGRDVYVFHTAALISIAEKMPPRLHAVNVDGVKNILRLCREYRVRRLVHVSSVHAAGAPGKAEQPPRPALF